MVLSTVKHINMELVQMNKKSKFDLIREVRKFEEMEGRKLGWDEFRALQQIGFYARKHRKLQERYCNGLIDEQKYDYINKQIEARILHKLEGVSKKLMIEFQHNPRGLTVQVSHTSNEEHIAYVYYFILGCE